jgi:hypothetical protein
MQCRSALASFSVGKERHGITTRVQCYWRTYTEQLRACLNVSYGSEAEIQTEALPRHLGRLKKRRNPD